MEIQRYTGFTPAINLSLLQNIKTPQNIYTLFSRFVLLSFSCWGLGTLGPEVAITMPVNCAVGSVLVTAVGCPFTILV